MRNVNIEVRRLKNITCRRFDAVTIMKKRLKLLGIILLLVAVIFWVLESFRIIPLTMSSEGVTIIMITILLPAIVGICLLVAGAAMKSE